VKQLVEDFARYLYLPRLKDSTVLLDSIRDGVGLLLWAQDSFGFADSYDEDAGRYRGLRGGQMLSLTDAHAPGLVVKPEVAAKQMGAESVAPTSGGSPVQNGGGGDDGEVGTDPTGTVGTQTGEPQPTNSKPKRFHGTAILDTTRVGRDASRIADEVIAHLSCLVGATVTVTIEVEAEIPSGAPDNVVRTVTENSRTLKFTSQGFEKE